MSDTAPFTLTQSFGTQQSPINIMDKITFPMGGHNSVILNGYDSIEGHIESHDQNHSVFKVDAKQSHTILVHRIEALLQQIHFHIPSEHTINGNYFDAEFHFVHNICKKGNGSGDGQKESSEFLVLGMLVNFTGSSTNSLDELIKNMLSVQHLSSLKESVQKQEDSDPMIFPSETVNALKQVYSKGYYFYRGSLTSGELIESVAWVVLKEPANLVEPESASELRLRQPSRSIQPINRRIVLKAIPQTP